MASTKNNRQATDDDVVHEVTLGRVAHIEVDDSMPPRFYATVDIGGPELLPFSSLASPDFRAGDLVAAEPMSRRDVGSQLSWVAILGKSRWRLCTSRDLRSIEHRSDTVFVVGPGMRLSTAARPNRPDDSRQRAAYGMLIIPEWAVSG